MSDIIGLAILIVSVFGFMYIMGRCFESDLKDIEKDNPKYRKFLKDKYGI